MPAQRDVKPSAAIRNRASLLTRVENASLTVGRDTPIPKPQSRKGDAVGGEKATRNPALAAVIVPPRTGR